MEVLSPKNMEVSSQKFGRFVPNDLLEQVIYINVCI